MTSRLLLALFAFSTALASASVVLAQVTTDNPGGGIRSRGAVIPQSGPVNQEAATAIDNALDSPSVDADAAGGPRKQGETQQEWQQLRQQERGTIAGRNDATDAAAPKNSKWRYARANNHWWYWMPNNSWAIYHNNRWIPYDAKTYGKYYPATATLPNPPMIAPSETRSNAGYGPTTNSNPKGQMSVPRSIDRAAVAKGLDGTVEKDGGNK